ncbi:hypothetical protein [Sphingosinithalassobacter sp. CS137]|uniref:hypothetical protein n=1 Tax=Sphingosinithalassobacter sp. CS137 TaxID=2762748 RepID=UPI00165D7A9B|nr:hypothetical protein [Sphingosinithalassobacter sp. CS137]
MNAVFLGSGARRTLLPLGKLLGEGASGKVYALPDMPGFAAKLYHGEKECRRHEAKIDCMLASRPHLPPAVHDGIRYPQIAWPEAKLHDHAGRFVGFLMPEIDFRRSTSLVNILQKNSRRIEKISEYYGYRVLVARNLASVFAELHRAGHHMIDMKPANLRFYPAVSWMAVVDTDGFSIAGSSGRMPADQLSDDYIAPESWQRRPAALGEAQDLFALAVIIFQLLDNGVHPFAGTDSRAGPQATDLQTRILEGLYPYAVQPPAGVSPAAASIHRMFRRATRTLFDRAFLPGAVRPSAAEWRDHLDELMTHLVPCRAKPAEHAHFGVGCGFCAHEARLDAARQSAIRRPPREAVRRRIPAGSRVPARRTAPMPRQRAVRRVRPRRSGGARWLVFSAATLAAVLLYLPEDLRREWLPPSGAVRVANAAPAGFGAADPPIEMFADARAYLVLPDAGGRPVALRNGPGSEFALDGELVLQDELTGQGRGYAQDGAPWIRVTRARDGAAGFVPEGALLQRAGRGDRIASTGVCDALPSDHDRLACRDPDVAASERMLEQRFRMLIDAAEGRDLSFLDESRRLWDAERASCSGRDDQVACRRSAAVSYRAALDATESVLRAGALPNSADAVPPLSFAPLQ